jgi:hypothetical protein
MIEAALDGVTCYPGRYLVATYRPQNLREGNVKITQPGVRGFLLRVLLLEVRREAILQVPHLMRKRAVLRRQQQSRQQYPQPAASQDHGVMPIYKA